MRDEPAGALRPVMAGGSDEADPTAEPRSSAYPEAAFVAVLGGAATLFLGIIPSPLFELAKQAGSTLGLL
jgi:NADH-quinone oxidoreductase subunit N